MGCNGLGMNFGEFSILRRGIVLIKIFIIIRYIDLRFKFSGLI